MDREKRRSPRYCIGDNESVVTLTTTDSDLIIWLAGDGTVDSLTVRYWCPSSDGYVHDVTQHPGTSGPQVCTALRYTGDALAMPSRAALAGCIRHEVRALLRVIRRHYEA